MNEKERVTEATPTCYDSTKVDKSSESSKEIEEKNKDNPLNIIRERLEAEAEEAATAGEQADTRENRFKAFLQKGWFNDLDEAITRPKFRFNIMGVDCVPSGEIIAVAGKAGAGKSTTLAILIGVLIGKTEFAGIRCLTPCKKILWIDTEKGAYSCQQKMRNFRRIANLGDSEQLADIGIYFAMMRQVCTVDRLYFINRLAGLDQFDAIVIDGVFDLTEDADKEFSEVTDLLRQLADTGASVFAMLHTNKAEGDDNMRYALGTELQRLCTTRFTIIYDKTTHCHTIKHDKSNDSVLAPEVVFMFDRDGSVIPKTKCREIDVKLYLQYVFQDGQSRDWKKLRADFVAKSGVTQNEAYNYLQEAQEKNWIITELDGNLNLNKDYF
jgi:Tfp pilus assembly pilus retraction ATPase PilT